jgi:hypothetical protein
MLLKSQKSYFTYSFEGFFILNFTDELFDYPQVDTNSTKRREGQRFIHCPHEMVSKNRDAFLRKIHINSAPKMEEWWATTTEPAADRKHPAGCAAQLARVDSSTIHGG